MQNNWILEYTQGLLSSFTDRNGNLYQYTYNDLGQFESEIDPIGGGWHLDTVDMQQGLTEILMTSAEGREYQYYKDKKGYNGRVKEYIEIRPDGTQVSKIHSPSYDRLVDFDGTEYSLFSYGSERLGSQYKFNHRIEAETPSAIKFVALKELNETTLAQGVILPVDESIITTTIDGKVWTSEFKQTIGNNGGYRYVSPEQRTQLALLDSQLRVSSLLLTGFDSLNIGYNTQGKINNLSIGSGNDERNSIFTYYTTGAMNGELKTVTNALGQTSMFEYDDNGRLVKQVLQDTREINFGYDSNGNLTSITPPGRPSHQINYNGMNQKTVFSAPAVPGILNTTTLFEYNLDQQPTKVIRPDGLEINMVYNDANGKLTRQELPTGNFVFDYDLATGKVIEIDSPYGITENYTYDGFLPMSTSWSGEVTGTVSRSYNSSFNVQSRSVNGASTVTYQYDNDNLVIGAGELTINREVQKGGLISETSLDNIETGMGYNSFGELESYDAKYSGVSFYQTSFARNKLGQITTKTEIRDGVTNVLEYDYDLSNRLYQVKTNGVITNEWAYDSNDNITHENGVLIGSYDNQDRIIDYKNKSYSYSSNGELQTVTDGANITTFDYDVLGNLIGVVMHDGTIINYLIDGRSRRVGKKINGVLTTAWLYKDKLNPIAELDAAGNVVSRFIYAEEDYVPSYMIKNGVKYKVISDHIGSPVKVINSTTGVVEQEISYDAWGNVVSNSSPGFQPFGFAGGLYDDHTKLTRFGYRDYSAETGRWTAKDPIEFYSGDINLYLYSMSDPINAYDPSGLSKKDKWYGFNDKDFRDYVHKEKELEGKRGNHNYSKDELNDLHEQWNSEGRPGGKGNKSGKGGKSKKGGGWAKRICKKIPGIGVPLLLIDLSEGGPEHAFNEATWPVSLIWSDSDEQ